MPVSFQFVDSRVLVAYNVRRNLEVDRFLPRSHSRMPPSRNYRDAASLIRHKGRQLAYQLSCFLLPDSLRSRLIAKALADTGQG